MRTLGLLLCSNIFMTFAWYGHLKSLRAKPLILVILISWSIAFFEYCLQVPANRIGIQYLNLGQLKIMQEIISMIVFAGFTTFFMKESLRWDYAWATLCIIGAAYFIFRGSLPSNPRGSLKGRAHWCAHPACGIPLPAYGADLP